MTIDQAAQVVMGAKPTTAAQLEEARKVMFDAARKGWVFYTDTARGSAANPCIVVVAPTPEAA